MVDECPKFLGYDVGSSNERILALRPQFQLILLEGAAIQLGLSHASSFYLEFF